MFNKFFVIFSLILQINFAEASTYFCSHTEVCRMAKIIFEENAVKDATLQSILIQNGDPHEFEPSIEDIKKLVEAPILVVGPEELNPWMKKISNIRKKNPKLITVNLPLPNFARTAYPTKETESLGHFWLYPQIYCHLKKELLINLKLKNFMCDFKTIEAELQNDLTKLNIPLILTHDALLPLFNKLTSNKKQIIAIKGSSHHEEVSATAIKKVYDALAKPKAAWIIEKNIAVSSNVKSKIRKTDIILNIDTAQQPDPIGNIEDFATLKNIHNQLQEIK